MQRNMLRCHFIGIMSKTQLLHQTIPLLHKNHCKYQFPIQNRSFYPDNPHQWQSFVHISSRPVAIAASQLLPISQSTKETTNSALLFYSSTPFFFCHICIFCIALLRFGSTLSFSMHSIPSETTNCNSLDFFFFFSFAYCILDIIQPILCAHFLFCKQWLFKRLGTIYCPFLR